MNSDLLSAVAIIVGCVSIFVAIASVIFGFWAYDRTKTILTKIEAQARSIERTVTGSQRDLLDSLLATTTRQQEITEELLTSTVIPALRRSQEPPRIE